ncbi:MAG: prepilin-type N-terminal cleavage/methylation domain-containing protein [Candidatus Saccharimonadales bacterium]
MKKNNNFTREWRGFKSVQAGFTIVELMIATLIFSIILTLITVGVVSFTNHYYKTVHISTTQNTTRKIIDIISQAIQFGTSSVTPTDPAKDYFCAGGYVFLYDTNGVQFTDTAGQRGLYMKPMETSICVPPTPPELTGGTQLLGDKMRITKVAVTEQPGSLYSVDVMVVYGEDDLFCLSDTPETCAVGAATVNSAVFYNNPNITCKTGIGSQFCAVSRLTASVQKRITN